MCEKGVKLFKRYMSTHKPKPEIETLKHTKITMKPKIECKFEVWGNWVWFERCKDEDFIRVNMRIMNGCDDWMKRLNDILVNWVLDKLWWRNERGILEELMTNETYQDPRRNEEVWCLMHVWRDNEQWFFLHKNALWADLLEACVDLNRSWVDTYWIKF